MNQSGNYGPTHRDQRTRSGKTHRFALLSVLLVALACAGLVTTRPSAAHASDEDQLQKGKNIGAAPLDLNASHLAYAHGMQVFVPTGSSSPNCLVTLREANNPFNVRPVFCGPRTQNGQAGVLVGVFFFEPAGDDVVIGLTLYQEGARSYGAPVLYSGN